MKTYQKVLYWPVWVITYLTGWSKLTRLWAPEQMVLKAPKSKLNYSLERKIYKQSKHYIQEGHTLTKRDYYTYKIIAQKYGWPYVKEGYDDN